MGLLIDTDVLILAERQRATLDFSAWLQRGTAFISAVTVSEWLVGGHDIQIAATALRQGSPILTRNGKDSRKLARVTVLDFSWAT